MNSELNPSRNPTIQCDPKLSPTTQKTVPLMALLFITIPLDSKIFKSLINAENTLYWPK